MKKLRFIQYGGFLVMLASMMLGACNDKTKEGTYVTDPSIMLYTYMSERDTDLTEFAKIVNLTNFAPMLNAYGNYTIFAPCNAAVLEYYKQHGKKSIEDYTSQADIDTLTTVVKFCILTNKWYTSEFIEGNIADTTLTGDVLTTRFGDGGIQGIMVNDEARIIGRDIEPVQGDETNYRDKSNGVIHKLDKVLTPLFKTVAQTIENDSKLSIFSQALKETGLYDTLNIKYYMVDGVSKKYKATVFAETDSVFKLCGINSYDDLKNKYSSGDPTKKTDGLHKFMAYHIVGGSYFITEFSSGLLKTYNGVTMIEVSELKGVKRFNYNKGKFVTFDIKLSNNVSKNGVSHKIDTLMEVYTPPITDIYWEPYVVPEIIGTYKSASGSGIMNGTFNDGDISSIRWTPGVTLSYNYNTGQRNTYGDYLTIGGSFWVEFTTPLIPAGKYQVWMATKNGSNRAKVQCYWDGKVLGLPNDTRVLASQFKNTKTGQFLSSSPAMTDSVYITPYDLNFYPETSKYPKFTYTKSPVKTADYLRKKIATVTLTTTETHKFKVQTLIPGVFWFDFIWFIPTN